MKDLHPTMQTTPHFPFYLRRSFYVHALLFSLTLIGGKVIIEQKKLLRDKNIQLVEASVRVDMVAMPKFTINELKNVSSGAEEAQKEEAAKVENKAIEKTPEKPVEKPVEQVVEQKHTGPTFEEIQEKKRQDFLGKLKALGNKKINSKGDQKVEKGLGGEKTSALKDLVLAGNKLSKGTSTVGSGNTAEMTAFQVYVSKLPDRVRPYWKLPSFLLEKKNLKCRVRIWLNMSGAITQAEVYQSSGDSEYDQRALEAVRSASPFPKLSEEYGRKALNGDIVLGFPL